ncbi:MAG: FAD-dependent oxidoreductase [Hyphomicrobiales bacterium]
MTKELPVAVIGAGPVGLAAAAHLIARGMTPVIFERGPDAGHAIAQWAHVRLFSPWRYNVDRAARALLEDNGWREPDPEALPTGGELLETYLLPLARHPEIAGRLTCDAEVTAIARDGASKISGGGREELPFRIRWRDAGGTTRHTLARAVIDTSGTWFSPNPMGADGLPVPGEREANGAIAYGIPDVLGRERKSYAGARVLVVGSGDSAINTVLDLLKLKEAEPATQISWAWRRRRNRRIANGGEGDQLAARGSLSGAGLRAMRSGDVTMLAPFAADLIERAGNGLKVNGWLNAARHTVEADRIVVAAGFRPDVSMLGEIRIALDPVVEATPALAPLIDPNLHSCGTVRPHGAAELSHPEKDLFIAGAKSYGRAPTFLMATGHEQVRSIAAFLAGDMEAAARVELELPETGVCITDDPEGEEAACCGGPSPQPSACCADDAAAKAEGKSGCGCEPAKELPVKTSSSCCGGERARGA